MSAEQATPRCRLYLITPPKIESVDTFCQALESTLAAGDVACLQIRLKDHSGIVAPDEDVVGLAKEAGQLCEAHDVALLINDRPDLALQVGADGVHIGQSDTSYAEARKVLGQDAIIGVTCHDSRHLALEAGERGADYVAFGAFYPTETKSASARAELELLTWWQKMIEIPCVAIGGIQLANAEPIVRAGADFLAVSSGVWSSPEGPAAAVRGFNALFDELAQ